MKPGTFGVSRSHGDLQNVDIIEDRSVRRKSGLPSRYQKGKFLGKGGFAKCYEVQDLESKEFFAAKIVSKASITKPRAHAKLRSEIAIHRELRHEKVVKFYDFFEDQEHVYIMLEVCPNQTLNEFMRRRPAKRLSEQEAIFYNYDLILALQYLHRRRIIHRDLKLGNLFLDKNMRLKVGDFGLAAQLEFSGDKRRTICGTPNYIAPEILEGKHGHSFEVDIWSLGVIVYTMVFGRPPFETSDVKTTYKKIKNNQYVFPEAVRVSMQVKDLIRRILQTDPSTRPSLDDILNSSWFCTSRVPPPMPDSVSSCSASPRLQVMPTYGGLTPVLSARQPGLSPIHTPLPSTPGRCQQQGRPPLAQRGNKENIVPNYGNATDVKENINYVGSFAPSCNGTFGQNRTLSSARLGDSARILDSPSTGATFGPGLPEECGNSSARHQSPRRLERGRSLSPAVVNSEVVTPRDAFRLNTARKASEFISDRPPPRAEGHVGSHSTMPEVWVTKWVDYASKYGVGYILSDGSIGVYFNDSTKIVLVPNGDRFDYITRRMQDKPEERNTYSWESYPEELKKKVTLLRNFKNYMMTDALERKDGASAGTSSLKNTAKTKANYGAGQVPFVKKWTRNKHAIMFQLSNKIVQVIFFDKTEAVLSSKLHTVTYIDKKGQATIACLVGPFVREGGAPRELRLSTQT
ncbi:unnamed protein product [Effrenium voratum]|uniref:Serine/threonine-protein kinase PLK n=1 Tax=Effrenium voratum TaxID=2562239 RepID=A0AA36I6D3_9DINO|nr:unnamed protein product [Effrenium voratum]CAJ1440105.1 unnamed protein product [Effrenium voratum]